MTQCSDSQCEREARMAVKTNRPTRANLNSTVYFDDRSAPKTALPYCKEHGCQLIFDLARALVAPDGDS